MGSPSVNIPKKQKQTKTGLRQVHADRKIPIAAKKPSTFLVDLRFLLVRFWVFLGGLEIHSISIIYVYIYIYTVCVYIYMENDK
jgi:hypothetical protein